VAAEEEHVQPVRVAPVSRAIAQRRAHLARDIIEVLVLIGIVFFITHFAIQGRQMPDTAMRPTLQPNQLVLVNTFSYLFGEPQRGDVIVFYNPAEPGGRPLIRRIIGIPNDTITLNTTAVLLNGVALNEPYISVPYGQTQNSTIDPGKKLNSREYYVMCDSRVSDACTNQADGKPIDSRGFGAVPRSNIVGKAVMVYWPLNSIHLLPNYSDVFSQAGKH
jgi:signal peptidase I